MRVGYVMVGVTAAVLALALFVAANSSKRADDMSPAVRYRAEFSGAYSARGPTERGLREVRLVAAPTTATVAGRPLKVWAYNGRVPGPVLRVQRGERLRVDFTNRLSQPTTIHWHGVRVPNAMDGVPGLTQPPIPPGGQFVYDFVPKDAGTFWFHPHVRGSEQVERGLFGVLIVDDAVTLPYTRDEVWILDDWLLTADGEIDPRFVTRRDLAHDGRWGNVVTVNGKLRERMVVPPGARVRLRFVDTANGRVFKPDFGGLNARVIAVDGMYTGRPVSPSGFELAPGNRLDVDITFSSSDAGKTFEIRDRLRRNAPVLGTIVVEGPTVPTPRFVTPANARIPDWAGAESLAPNVTYALDARRGGEYGIQWTINGRAYPNHETGTLVADRWQKIRFDNQSTRMHPMHIHGQFFKLLTRNGRVVDEPYWRDTVLLHPREKIDIGIVPLDEGDWLLHCHILEHAESGMKTVVRVGSQTASALPARARPDPIRYLGASQSAH